MRAAGVITTTRNRRNIYFVVVVIVVVDVVVVVIFIGEFYSSPHCVLCNCAYCMLNNQKKANQYAYYSMYSSA